MKKLLIGSAFCILFAGSALAQPLTLTDAQLDGVVAGLFSSDNNGNGNGNIGDGNGNDNFNLGPATATATASSFASRALTPACERAPLARRPSVTSEGLIPQRARSSKRFGRTR